MDDARIIFDWHQRISGLDPEAKAIDEANRRLHQSVNPDRFRLNADDWWDESPPSPRLRLHYGAVPEDVATALENACKAFLAKCSSEFLDSLHSDLCPSADSWGTEWEQEAEGWSVPYYSLKHLWHDSRRLLACVLLDKRDSHYSRTYNAEAGNRDFSDTLRSAVQYIEQHHDLTEAVIELDARGQLSREIKELENQRSQAARVLADSGQQDSPEIMAAIAGGESLETLAAAQDPPNLTIAVAEPGAGVACLVTLQQAAAIVNRDKRTLERYKSQGYMPGPCVKQKPGCGMPDEWDWNELRPWLEEKFNKKLPEVFPGRRAV